MHKSKRDGLKKQLREYERLERKIQELAFNGKSEARRERARMIENRHWYDRDRKGELRTGNAREVKGHTLRAADVVAGVRSI